METIKIRMFGKFSIDIAPYGDFKCLGKSKKGATLLAYLVLHAGEAVPTTKLFDVLWPDERVSNPENALKTLVSRFRSCAAEYGDAVNFILTERGTYRWNSDLPCDIDLMHFETLSRMALNQAELNAEMRAMVNEILSLYAGDLLTGLEDLPWVTNRRMYFHSLYLQVVYHALDAMVSAGDYDAVIEVCRAALDIDPFDERLNVTLMDALVKKNRVNDAMLQYRHATDLHYNYLGAQPPEGIQEFYKQLIKIDDHLGMDLEDIRASLQEGKRVGAFLCEYVIFKDIYHLNMRNLERLGGSYYLAIMMVQNINNQPIAPLVLDSVMKHLQSALINSLRKGDTVARYSGNQYVVLLPFVNDQTGRMVMERVKRAFYALYPNSSITVNYRLSPVVAAAT